MTYVALAARLVLAGVFLVSGLAKARSFPSARAMVIGVLEAAPMAPPGRLAGPLTRCLIAVELLTGVAVLPYDPAAPAGLVVAGALLVAFTVLAALAAGGRLGDMRCACFGRAAAPLGARHIPRNLALLAIVGLGLAGPLPPWPPTANPGAGFVAALAALVLILLVVGYDDIADIVGTGGSVSADRS